MCFGRRSFPLRAPAARVPPGPRAQCARGGFLVPVKRRPSECKWLMSRAGARRPRARADGRLRKGARASLKNEAPENTLEAVQTRGRAGFDFMREGGAGRGVHGGHSRSVPRLSASSSVSRRCARRVEGHAVPEDGSACHPQHDRFPGAADCAAVGARGRDEGRARGA